MIAAILARLKPNYEPVVVRLRVAGLKLSSQRKGTDVASRKRLSLAMARVDEDFSAESAAVEAAMDLATQEVYAEFEVIQAVQEDAPPAAPVKPRVRKALADAERDLELAMDEESKFQAEMAEATWLYENTVARAVAERDAAFSRITAELDDIIAHREAVALFKDALVKADF